MVTKGDWFCCLASVPWCYIPYAFTICQQAQGSVEHNGLLLQEEGSVAYCRMESVLCAEKIKQDVPTYIKVYLA